eukprot:2217292-Pleurochrysis_carterae.AAC.1
MERKRAPLQVAAKSWPGVRVLRDAVGDACRAHVCGVGVRNWPSRVRSGTVANLQSAIVITMLSSACTILYKLPPSGQVALKNALQPISTESLRPTVERHAVVLWLGAAAHREASERDDGRCGRVRVRRCAA